jgi:hypothetical protein
MTTETIDPISAFKEAMICERERISNWQLDQLGFSPRLTAALMRRNRFKTVGDVWKAGSFEKLPGVGEKLWEEWEEWQCDPQRLRVYAADYFLMKIAKPLPSLQKVRAFIARLFDDPVIRARYPTAGPDYLPKVIKSEGGNASGDWESIAIPGHMRNEAGVCHEAAHCIAQRVTRSTWRSFLTSSARLASSALTEWLSISLTCTLNQPVCMMAWRASIQITGRPSRLSSVHSHVDGGPVSRPTRTASGAFDFT